MKFIVLALFLAQAQAFNLKSKGLENIGMENDSMDIHGLDTKNLDIEGLNDNIFDKTFKVRTDYLFFSWRRCIGANWFERLLQEVYC